MAIAALAGVYFQPTEIKTATPSETVVVDYTLAKGDTFASVLDRHGISHAIAAKWIKGLSRVYSLSQLQSGNRVRFEVQPASSEITSLTFELGPTDKIEARLENGLVVAKRLSSSLSSRRRTITTTIGKDFFVDASASGVPDERISDVAALLASRTELGLVEPGTKFDIQFAEYDEADGKAKAGALLGFRLTQPTRDDYEVSCFQVPGRPEPLFYTPSGKALGGEPPIPSEQEANFGASLTMRKAAYAAAERAGGSLVLAPSESPAVAAECRIPDRSASSDPSYFPTEEPSSRTIGRIGTPPAKTRVYSMEHLDPSVASLPPDYAGNDLAAIARASMLTGAQFEKDEFETTAQFKERSKNIEAPRFSEQLSGNGLLALRVEPQSARYDADKQEFSLDLSTLRCVPSFAVYDKGNTACDVNVIVLERELDNERNYEASNAMGASVEVEERSYSVIGILDANTFKRPVAGISRESGLSLKLPLDSEKARQAKGSLAVLVLVRLRAPYHDFGFKYLKATFNDPLELTYNIRALVADTVALWVYNASTGEIYKKFDR